MILWLKTGTEKEKQSMALAAPTAPSISPLLAVRSVLRAPGRGQRML